MNKRNLLFALLLIINCFSITKAESINTNTFAIVVGGISKESQDKQIKARTVSGLQKFFLEDKHIAPETLAVLTAENTADKSSKKENIQKIVDNYKSKINSNDRFIFYYTGQANVVGQKLRLNLPGEDITHEQLGILLKDIKASSILIVLDCPASGIAINVLSGKNRIIICSCTDVQFYSTKFSEFFVPALTNQKTDIDEDGKISLLEIFTITSKHLEDWYRQKQLALTETPMLDDNADGKGSKEPWRYMLDVKDGMFASEFFL